MSPDELRELAGALANGTHFVDSQELHEAMTKAANVLRQCAEQRPVAWKNTDLDGMVEAFHRVIESHADKYSPFHQPVNADAIRALRILRGLLPAMKAMLAAAPVPPKREPLSEDEISKLAWKQNIWTDGMVEFSFLAFAREVERAHGIGGSDAE